MDGTDGTVLGYGMQVGVTAMAIITGVGDDLGVMVVMATDGITHGHTDMVATMVTVGM